MILAVETSTRAFSLAVSGDVSGTLELEREMTHSQHIVAAVRFLCDQLGIVPSAFTEVYAGIGPGSFTGTRIGLSFANTLKQLYGVPLTGVASLDVLAYENGRWYNSVIPFIRSRRDEVYTAYYERGALRTEYRVLRGADFRRFIERYRPDHIVASGGSLTDVLGDGWGDRQIASTPKSGVMIDLVRETRRKRDGGYLKPLYVRGFT